MWCARWEGCSFELASGLLELASVALGMDTACRDVHERFATTISSGVVGVPFARELRSDTRCTWATSTMASRSAGQPSTGRGSSASRRSRYYCGP
jgi:hypothetical protein